MLLTLIVGLFTTLNVSAQQDKSKRVSPPLAPAGKVWRTGANEATVFETSKDVSIEGQKLPAGKYSIYSIPGEKEWTMIFNKTWKQWGTVYKESEDALRINVKPKKSKQFAEMMTFEIAKNGKVSLMWADTQIDFKVQ